MKKTSKFFIILASIFALVSLFVTTTPNKALTKEWLSNHNANKEKTVTLYEQTVGNLNNAQIDELWPSNNPRSWIFTGTMDGEIVKKYRAWHNRYKSTVKGTADERGLDNDTDLTIHIKNLNIKTSDYQDIRLVIDYLSTPVATIVTKTNSFELYMIDGQKKRYGPYKIEYFEPTGFYMRKAGENKIYERNLALVSGNIKTSNATVISELEIRPYANYPKIADPEKTMIGDWHKADNTFFKVAGMKIVGYKNSSFKKPHYIKTKFIDVNKTRENIVKRMYDLATVKWTPSTDFHDIRTVGSDPHKIRTTYKKGNIYYGPPYTQRNRVPVEKFASEIRNGQLSQPENIRKVCGADCSSSVSYSISKFIPLHTMYNPADFIWDRNTTTLLGNLKTNGKEAGSDSLKKNYSEQDFCEAYAKIKKGDIVSAHYKKNTHVQLISGNTHVERNTDGTIDPVKSYFIRTDIRIGQANTLKGSNDFGGMLNDKDYVVPFEPKKNYTDITDLRELEGKNLNFYINKKTTFRDAYRGNYVPLTLNAYLTATTEEPYIRLINGNTVTNIENGFKGTIYSNYTILNITFNIKNDSTGEHKTFTVYPDHDITTKDSGYSSIYSLYYNTPKYIQDYLKNTITKTNNYKITISVSAGEKENMTVLDLK